MAQIGEISMSESYTRTMFFPPLPIIGGALVFLVNREMNVSMIYYYVAHVKYHHPSLWYYYFFTIIKLDTKPADDRSSTS